MSGEMPKIYFGEKYVRINGENAFHYIDLDSVFWQLDPGENILSYQSNNDSIKTRVIVKWKNRYIGLWGKEGFDGWEL